MNPKVGLLCIGVLGAMAATGTTIHLLKNKEELASEEEKKKLDKAWIKEDSKYEERKEKVKALLKTEANKDLFKATGERGKEIANANDSVDKDKIKTFCEDAKTNELTKYKKYHAILKDTCTTTT